MPLFSIIIPVYNVEKYLNECVKSVLLQEFSDFEVILVDDYSPDNCGKICDEYANSDSRVSVIHHECNMGLSEARNSGIRLATGKYLLFLDSDDFFFEGNLKKISTKLQESPNTDVVFLSMSKCWKRKKSYNIKEWKRPKESEFIGLTNKEILKKMCTSYLYNPQVGSKAVKRELIIRNSLFFKKGIYSEDLPWTFELLNKTSSYLVCEADHYIYRERPGSISHSKSGKYKSISDIIDFVYKWAEYCKNKSNKNSEIYLCPLAYQYSILLGQLFYFSKKERSFFADKIKHFNWILENSSEKKTKLVKTIYNIFGFWICAFILNVFLRCKDLYLHLNYILFSYGGNS